MAVPVLGRKGLVLGAQVLLIPHNGGVEGADCEDYVVYGGYVGNGDGGVHPLTSLHRQVRKWRFIGESGRARVAGE